MSENTIERLGTVTVKDGLAAIVFERYYPHPPEKVWKVITEREHLLRWYQVDAHIEGRPGGTVDMIWGNGGLHVTGKVLQWIPPRLFEHEWKIAPARGLPDGENTIVRWELDRKGDGTQLRLSHLNYSEKTVSGAVRWLDPISAEHAYLDRMEAYMDSRDMPEFPERLRELQPKYHGRPDHT